MSALRNRTGAAAAIAVLMVLSTLAGAVAATPHASAAAPAHAATTVTPSVATKPLSLGTPTNGGATISAPAKSSSTGDDEAPAAPAAVADASSSSTPETATISTLQADGVPLKDAFLPDLNANPHPSLSTSGTTESPYATGGPAPIGVAEYGIVNESGTLTATTYTTTSLIGTFSGSNYFCYELGNCTPKVLAQDTGDPDWYAIQLNAVLENVTLYNTPGYSFWTQNVLEYSTYLHQAYLVSNIWNFTSYHAGINTSAIAGHGPNGTVVPGELYYSVSGPFNISSNFEALLGLDSIEEYNDDGVLFTYTIDNQTVEYSGIYDWVFFNSTGPAGPGVDTQAQYVANGSAYTADGTPTDWEFVLGGPGGGSNLDIFSLYTEMDLYYWNPTYEQYSVVPSAYDVGGETGETSTGGSALWEGDWAPYTSGPGELITPGPTFVSGLWNVTNSTQGYAVLFYDLAPSNGFTFFGQTDQLFDYAAYAWAAPRDVYFLPPAFYAIWSLASNYFPAWNEVILGNATEDEIFVGLDYSAINGVYTPLWALNETGLENITWNGFNLYNNEYGPLGDDPDIGLNFPWFGEANDYLYPVFPGILLWDVYDAAIVAPPPLTINYPASEVPFLKYFGLPTTNNLPILVYDAFDILLAGGIDISGWWFTPAEYGPTVPAYNVVFWNVSESYIFNNYFATSSNALYLYGGYDNEIWNNSFVQTLPYAFTPYLSGYEYGTYALFDADFGDYYAYLFGEDAYYYWDGIYNNIFDTYFTAYSPATNPYTGYTSYFPPLFSEAWNVPYTPGETNIIGGDYLGGNYWWNYGSFDDPYGDLPYNNFNIYYLLLWDLDPYGIYWAGDFLPLTPTPIVTVTFVEVGLAPDTVWSPLVEAVGGGFIANFTNLPYSNESWINGTYYLTADVFANYTYVGNTTLVVDGAETVYMYFVPDFVLAFHEVGLPAGEEWVVEVIGYDYFDYDYSDTPWANFSVPAGDYEYEVYAFGYYEAYDEFGGVTVSAPTVVPVAFDAVYSVAFDQSGLPAGYNWTIIIQSDGPDGNVSGTVAGTSVFLGYAFGGYTYKWWVVAPGYVGTPASGSVLLKENTTISVTFAAAESLTFDESGLAAGSPWTVTFTQDSVTTTVTSTGTSITVSAEAGAYTYTVSASGYVPTVGSGAGTLPGGPIDVVFNPAPATIDFEATGLPVGTHWTVEFTQGATTTPHSGTGTIAISAVDGAYSYTANSTGYTATPASGSGVLPENAEVTIAFAPTPSTVDFSPTGLAAGTVWTVDFTQGATTTDYSGTGTIAVTGVVGAFSYTAKAQNYTASGGSGDLPTETVTVAFTIVDGTLAGSVAPSGATVTVGGTVETLTDGAFSVTLAPGSYAVSVTASGYYAYNTTVTVASGKTTHLAVNLQAIPAKPKPFLGLSSSTDWALVGLLAALAAVFLITTLVLLVRGRRPPEAPPKSWAEGSSAPGGAAGGSGSAEWSEGGPASPPSGSK